MTETNLISKRICCVCGGSQKSNLFRQQFTRLSDGGLMDGYDVVMCNNCGFVFADNIPDQKDFDEYYRNMSKYEHQDRLGRPTEFESRQFQELAQVIRSHIENQDARILEIGCANGGLLNAIREMGYQNVLGIDPSPACARNAELLYHIPVSTCALSNLRTDIGQFDFIILVAVLEHIRDLDSALTKLSSMLSPTSKLYVEVPDASNFASSPDAPFQEFSMEHINFFTSQSLTNLMGVHGFSRLFSTQKLYNQTDTHAGYTIRMVFQKTDQDREFRYINDTQVRPAIEKYVAVSRKVETRIHNIINDVVDSHKPLIIWGVGTHTQRLLATSRLSKANIVSYVDSNPNYQGKELNGIQIINPTNLDEKPETILVSSRTFQNEIIHRIRSELKLRNEIVALYED
ncbi:MAG TPA: class I SAM-dependent methyltransferase [Anaerolineales bacterium]|nr:class I SAM-dependent methyltransferase [Anaerolineales bacterium]